MRPLGLELPQSLRQVVAESWAARTHVEEISAVQFHRLAAALLGLSAPTRLIEVAVRAAEDEGRHRELCAELALSYGVDPGPLSPAFSLAPPGLPAFEACLYAAVAHCCVAETESVATLTELIGQAGPLEVRTALSAIARDEVQHAQLGWAIVTWGSRQCSLSFLERSLPSMLQPGAGPLFGPSLAGSDDPRLIPHGVLPAAARRQVFTATLEQVLLPGLERVGIGGASARIWLAQAVTST